MRELFNETLWFINTMFNFINEYSAILKTSVKNEIMDLNINRKQSEKYGFNLYLKAALKGSLEGIWRYSANFCEEWRICSDVTMTQ
jgi:hypothetical protein